jgi:antitoxin component YwqK of YwqJK toxin-antitoxin module
VESRGFVRHRSFIPVGVIEQVVSLYRRKGGTVWFQKVECLLGETVVGHRFYDSDGALLIETPLRGGKKHGVEFHWYDGGESLESAEPYHEGLPHGTAKQWDEDGTLLGTYTLNHGSGLDLWRCQRCGGGAVFLSEVHEMKDGQPHGYEWWLNEDQRSVDTERHWNEGRLHGIEREWNAQGRLKRGYPRYYIRGERVSKRAYVKACTVDPTLPAVRAAENEPLRRFPPKVARELEA